MTEDILLTAESPEIERITGVYGEDELVPFYLMEQAIDEACRAQLRKLVTNFEIGWLNGKTITEARETSARSCRNCALFAYLEALRAAGEGK